MHMNVYQFACSYADIFPFVSVYISLLISIYVHTQILRICFHTIFFLYAFSDTVIIRASERFMTVF